MFEVGGGAAIVDWRVAKLWGCHLVGVMGALADLHGEVARHVRVCASKDDGLRRLPLEHVFWRPGCACYTH